MHKLKYIQSLNFEPSFSDNNIYLHDPSRIFDTNINIFQVPITDFYGHLSDFITEPVLYRHFYHIY